ncbi:acetamidase/formamidase family protein [Acidithiobacillus ferrivorans]|uniref:acetamidase/formamidase family protein n=1 Tax=Acidithiobacillus ferrivorans TaxID=160808 RepID=UPI0018E4E598|nr:acetamidase/formamidase family protein [Acidithiobacillus ferrivorans]
MAGTLRIGAGAKMVYPVFVDGVLFFIGDSHISQGDGDLDGTAMEASLDVVIRVTVRRCFYFSTSLLMHHKEWLIP